MGWVGVVAVVAFALVAFVAVEEWKHQSKVRWLWVLVAAAIGATALIYAPLGGGSCRVDWDGRGNPVECE